MRTGGRSPLSADTERDFHLGFVGIDGQLEFMDNQRMWRFSGVQMAGPYNTGAIALAEILI